MPQQCQENAGYCRVGFMWSCPKKTGYPPIPRDYHHDSHWNGIILGTIPFLDSAMFHGQDMGELRTLGYGYQSHEFGIDDHRPNTIGTYSHIGLKAH